MYLMYFFFLQNSCGQSEIVTSNNSHQCLPTNTNAVPGVSIPANEQVMAIKHGQLRIDANSKLSNSHTLDSLNELQVSKTGTPSMISRYLIISEYVILETLCVKYLR